MRSYKNLYPGYLGKPDTPENLYKLCLYYVGLIERILLKKNLTTEEILPQGKETTEANLKKIVKKLFDQYDLPAVLGTKILGDEVCGATVINLPEEMIKSLRDLQRPISQIRGDLCPRCLEKEKEVTMEVVDSGCTFEVASCPECHYCDEDILDINRIFLSG